MSNQWNLTERQIEILEIAAQGKPAKWIARELGLSPKTVDVHFARIMFRMEAANRTQAILMWDRARRPSIIALEMNHG